MSNRWRLAIVLFILLFIGQASSVADSGLSGIKNKISPAVPTANTSEQAPAGASARQGSFAWHFKGKIYQVTLVFSEDLYQLYLGSPHTYQFSGALPNNWQDDYYGQFLKVKPQDRLISSVVAQLRQRAMANLLSDDELAELTMAFVQAIPYEDAKALNKNAPLYYPYETLYKKTGICSDKVLLAMVLLKELGYGTALLSYVDQDHAAVGIQCPNKYALPDTIYCYGETTNFFPIGFVPQIFSDTSVALKQPTGQGITAFDKVFDPKILGGLITYQASRGKVYQGIVKTYQEVDKLKSEQKYLDATKGELTSIKSTIDSQTTKISIMSSKLQEYRRQGDAANYNLLLQTYNDAAAAYNDLVNNYRLKTDGYNNTVVAFNKAIIDLYAADK